jgi:hypothetical protein
MRYNLPVPFELYLYACAAALLITFALMGWFMRAPAGAPVRIGAMARAHPIGRLPSWLIVLLQVGALLCLGMSVLAGLLGTQDPDDNLNLTLFWEVFLLGFVYATAVIGNVYALANPWETLVKLMGRNRTASGRGRYQYAESLGYWPAVACYIALIWLELFTIPGPRALSLILLGYSALTFAGAWLFGAPAWFKHCELFSVLLRVVGTLAPLAYRPDAREQRSHVQLRWPLVGIFEEHPRSISFVVFVLCLLAGTTYDGMHQTLFWKGLYWHRLLPMFQAWRGGHVPDSTLEHWYDVYQRLGLVVFPFLYLGIYLAILRLGKAAAHTALSVHSMAVAFILSILPIALVYNMAHYYTLILIRLRVLPYLFTDPFGYEWNPLHLPHLGDPPILKMAMVWHVEVGLILCGHIAAVWLAHRIALHMFASRREAVMSQVPMLILMLAYTVIGLWVISLPFALT